MLLPLHSFLNLLKLDNVLLVVDNAQSHRDPFSFRNKRAACYGDSCSNSNKNRWSSMPPLLDAKKDTSSSSSMDGKCRRPLRSKSEAGERTRSSAGTMKREKVKRSTSDPLRMPARQVSPVATQRRPCLEETPEITSTSKFMREKFKRSSSCPLQIPVRQLSPVVTQRKRLVCFKETPEKMSASTTMTKIDTKSVTSSTGSLLNPFRRRSRKSMFMGSPEQSCNHMSISNDLAELEKLTRSQLIDTALDKMVTDAYKSAAASQTSLHVG
jgi:hypothetical protein